eukprot:708747-Amphidinium_carterae.1
MDDSRSNPMHVVKVRAHNSCNDISRCSNVIIVGALCNSHSSSAACGGMCMMCERYIWLVHVHQLHRAWAVDQCPLANRLRIDHSLVLQANHRMTLSPLYAHRSPIWMLLRELTARAAGCYAPRPYISCRPTIGSGECGFAIGGEWALLLSWCQPQQWCSAPAGTCSGGLSVSIRYLHGQVLLHGERTRGHAKSSETSRRASLIR